MPVVGPIAERLAGMQKILIALYESGVSLTSASKGVERETFVRAFLEQIFPNRFRFGTGDAVDRLGERSGQLDVVIEYPFLPSFPTFHDQPRLYLTEGIAAVIEVKSNVADHWTEVMNTAKTVHALDRYLGPAESRKEREEKGIGGHERIPLFAVGYRGWKTLDTVKEHLTDVDGILVIDEGLFACKGELGGFEGTGVDGMWAFICALHHAIASLLGIGTVPADYLVK